MNSYLYLFFKKHIYFVAFIPLLILYIIVFLKLSDIKNLHFALSILPFLFLLLNNFKYVFIVIILLLFIKLLLSGQTIAVLFTYFLFISFFLCFPNTHFRDFKNPFTFPIVIYLVSTIPSFFNNQEIFKSLWFMSGLIVAFLLVHFIYATNEKKLINIFLKVYLFFCFLNGLTAIYDGLILKKRAFGIAGIMYVDYVSVGIVIAFVLMLLTKKKFFYLSILGFFFFCSIIHQTRGIWIVLTATLLCILLFFYFKNKYYSIKKKSIVFILLSSFILVGISFVILKDINPAIEKRASQIENLENSIDKEGYVQNSLITRAMIWTTAYNAFKAHPIIGIGAHSFQFQSKQYSTLHPLMYKLYVKGLSPHGTYFTIPPETGLIGLTGFLIMTFLIFKHSYSNIKKSKTFEDKKISTILFFLLLYINFSMVITDAWLFGSGAILWGIVLGLNVLHNKKLLQVTEGSK